MQVVRNKEIHKIECNEISHGMKNCRCRRFASHAY